MGRGESKFELLLLFDRLKMEPKKLHRWLKERGQEYSYFTLKKYYGYYNTAELQVRAMMEAPTIKLKRNGNGR